jgi:hypothetical protein
MITRASTSNTIITMATTIATTIATLIAQEMIKIH